MPAAGQSRQKSPRTRTLDAPLSECAAELARCLAVRGSVSHIEDIACRTILGDAFEVLPLLPKGSIDLLAADPPYNLDKTYGGSRFHKMSGASYEKFTLRWLELVRPLLKETASVYVCCDWRSGMIVGNALERFFTVRNRITWQREKGRGAKANWKSAHEDIWFATVSDSWTFNLDAVKMRRRVLAPYRQDGVPKDWQETPDGRFRDTCPSNFWDDLCVPFWSMPENTAHPAQKPEKLMAKIILAGSRPGDIVLDPFFGSGSSGVAAKKLGRRWIGIEREPLYCAWAERRLAAAHEGDPIQGYADGIFWERHALDGREGRRRAKS